MWKDLTLAQRSQLIGEAVRNGISNLDEIRNLYNSSSQVQQTPNGELFNQPTGDLNKMSDGTSYGDTMPGNIDYTKRQYSMGGNLYAGGGKTSSRLSWTPSAELKKFIAVKEGSSMYAPAPDTGKVNRSFEAEAGDFVRSFTDEEWEALPENIKEGLYSYSYNVGAGNFRKRVMPAVRRYLRGNGSIKDIQNSMWATRDSELRGLRIRRAQEKAIVGGTPISQLSGVGEADFVNTAPQGNAYRQSHSYPHSFQSLLDSNDVDEEEQEVVQDIPEQDLEEDTDYTPKNEWLDVLFKNTLGSLFQEEQQKQEEAERLAYISQLANSIPTYQDYYRFDNGGKIGPTYNPNDRRWYNAKGQQLVVGKGYWSDGAKKYVMYGTDGSVSKYTPSQWAQKRGKNGTKAKKDLSKFTSKMNHNRGTNTEDLAVLQDSMIARNYPEAQRLAILGTAAQEMDNRGYQSIGVGGNGILGFNTVRMPERLIQKGNRGEQISWVLNDLEGVHNGNWGDGGKGGPVINSGYDGYKQFWDAGDPLTATQILNKSNIRPAGRQAAWNKRVSVANNIGMLPYKKAYGGNLYAYGDPPLKASDFKLSDQYDPVYSMLSKDEGNTTYSKRYIFPEGPAGNDEWLQTPDGRVEGALITAPSKWKSTPALYDEGMPVYYDPTTDTLSSSPLNGSGSMTPDSNTLKAVTGGFTNWINPGQILGGIRDAFDPNIAPGEAGAGLIMGNNGIVGALAGNNFAYDHPILTTIADYATNPLTYVGGETLLPGRIRRSIGIGIKAGTRDHGLFYKIGSKVGPKTAEVLHKTGVGLERAGRLFNPSTYLGRGKYNTWMGGVGRSHVGAAFDALEAMEMAYEGGKALKDVYDNPEWSWENVGKVGLGSLGLLGMATPIYQLGNSIYKSKSVQQGLNYINNFRKSLHKTSPKTPLTDHLGNQDYVPVIKRGDEVFSAGPDVPLKVKSNASLPQYEIIKYPGYQLKSLMAGNKLEKQLAKNGSISINSIKAHINKGNKIEKAIVDRVLSSERFAGKKSVDYNEFRKAVQDELMPINVVPTNKYEKYGVPEIGYDDSNVIFDTFTLESPKLPRGNNKHYNDNTLAHSRTLVSKDEPEIRYVLESQSDHGQARYYSEDGREFTRSEYEGEFPGEDLAVARAREREFLSEENIDFKNRHSERLIQENLRRAAMDGQSRMRYPTKETAYKIEQYKKLPNGGLEIPPEVRKEYEATILSAWRKYNAIKQSAKKEYDAITQPALEKYEAIKQSALEEGRFNDKIAPILARYESFPKQYKKLYKDAEVRTVTDSKGNTWYEVDVPKDYLEQEHPYAQGGPMRKRGASFEEWYKTVPEDRNDTTNYNLRRAYELAPWEELEAWRNSSLFDLNNGKNHLNSSYHNPSTGVYEFMKSKNHPSLHNETNWYYGKTPALTMQELAEQQAFRRNYFLNTQGDYYKYVPRTWQIFATGGKTATPDKNEYIQNIKKL